MKLSDFQAVNATRGRRWHQGHLDKWSLLEWAGAMAGETGEACNVAKKIRRIDVGLPNKQKGLDVSDLPDLKAKMANEVADSIIYGLLIMSVLELDAETVIAEVFNQKSIEYGFPERAPLRSSN